MITEDPATFHEDFGAGIDLDCAWELLSVPPADFVADDGRAERVEGGIRIRASGSNPDTGEPAFTKFRGDALDHLKWMAWPRQISRSGVPGFDVTPDGRLGIEFRVSGRTFGTRSHPFGSHVVDADTDLRLASALVLAMDQETGLVFGFWITARAIHPCYERLMVPGPDPGFQVFSSVFPPVSRNPTDVHTLALSYDAGAGRAVYTVDGSEVAAVTDLGHPAGAARMLVNSGGTATIVRPRQLLPGFGLLTSLDGAGEVSPSGLVALEVPYVSPTDFVGGPQLFGQGAEITVFSVHVGQI